MTNKLYSETRRGTHTHFLFQHKPFVQINDDAITYFFPPTVKRNHNSLYEVAAVRYRYSRFIIVIIVIIPCFTTKKIKKNIKRVRVCINRV